MYYKKLIFFYKKIFDVKNKFNFFNFLLKYKKIIDIESLSNIDSFLSNFFSSSYEYIYFFIQRLFYVYQYIFFSISNSLFFNLLNVHIFFKKKYKNIFFFKKNDFSFLTNLSVIKKKIYFYFLYKRSKDSFFNTFFFFDNHLYN